MKNKKLNVILIVVDALRARNLGCYGYPFPTTPNIDKLAKQGLLFKNCFSVTASTDPAFTSIFSGLYPFSHGILNHGDRVTEEEEKKVAKVKLLPEILKGQGYKTFGLDFLGRWHRRGFDFYLGIEEEEKKPLLIGLIEKARRIFGIRPGSLWQHVLEKTPIYDFVLKLVLKSTPYTPADKLTDRAISILERNRENRFFLFLHYWDSHQPYRLSKKHFSKLKNLDYKKYYGRPQKNMTEILATKCSPLIRNFLEESVYGEEDPLQVIKFYDSEISFLDENIGRLVKRLKELDIFKNTLVIFTADHGESLLEHGLFTHKGLYNEILQVPLIIVGPGVLRGVREALVQTIDLTPTVLDFLKIETGIDFDGFSFFPVFENDRKIRSTIFAQNHSPLKNEACLIQGRYKYIKALTRRDNICEYCGRPHSPYEELFDLENDPWETKNLAKTKKRLAQDLRKQLNEYISQLKK